MQLPGPLFLANVAVWLLLALVVGLYAPESAPGVPSPLDWGRANLDRYATGNISESVERSLYRAARDDVRRGRNLEEARVLLEQALEIDPYCEAGYWIGRYHIAVGDDEAARVALERYLQIDPVMVEAWLHLAAIHERAGRIDAAATTLERGRRWFEVAAPDYTPVPVAGTPGWMQSKAVRVHEYYRIAPEMLRREADRLGRHPR